MKYRTKLYLYFSGTAVISSLIGLGILLNEFREHVFSDQQIKAMTVTSTTAALFDVDTLKQINVPSDEQTPAYQEIKKELLKVRDANRRHDIRVYFLYTLKPEPDHPNEFIYLVDAEEDPEWVSHVGDKVESSQATGLAKHLLEDYSPGKFVSDWGKWTTGYAPIYDKNGKYVATVGVDISIHRFFQIFAEVLQSFVLGFGASILFALIGGHWLARQVSSSLNTLFFCVKEIGRGNLHSSAALHTQDEFEEVSAEIDQMTAGLRERERLKLNFARYVSQQVVEKILKAEDVAKLSGERRKITVLFSDIRQFTKLAESLP